MNSKSVFFGLDLAALSALAITTCLGTNALATIAGERSNSIAEAPAPQTSDFAYDGEFTQGGWIKGEVTGEATEVTLDGKPLQLGPDGAFFAAFDRDAGEVAKLSAKMSNGLTLTRDITISRRAWKIERVKAAKKPGGKSNAEYAKIRAAELAEINAARSINPASDGWRQKFAWPTLGRISGLFGSQRIYNGEAGSYHTGIDIAGGNGTAFTSPADGVVVLAAEKPFSLEGYLLIIDHGNGLSSSFLHCSRLAVKKGDVVKRLQYLGNIGASGRASGPHLHWGLKWRDARLDPLLFTGPMPPH